MNERIQGYKRYLLKNQDNVIASSQENIFVRYRKRAEIFINFT